jgi:hypothetical protein
LESFEIPERISGNQIDLVIVSPANFNRPKRGISVIGHQAPHSLARTPPT